MRRWTTRTAWRKDSRRGEVASVRWVSLSEADSFLSRLLAMGFILHPLYSAGMFPGAGAPGVSGFGY